MSGVGYVYCPFPLLSFYINTYFGILQNGRTALHIASERGHTSTVQVLLESGAQVDLTDQVCNCAIIVLTHTLLPSLYL